MSTKDQVAELSISQEDNKEHDGKSGHVLGASTQSQAELSHGLVEVDILEDLDPRDEHNAGKGVQVLLVPVAQELKVNVLIGIFEQITEQTVDLDVLVDIEDYANHAHAQDHHVQNVPDTLEVAELVFLDLEHLLDKVVQQVAY